MAGCAAVGVLPTSDPGRKLGDANAMMAQGRALRARQFAAEAFAIYQNKGDAAGQARAHSVLGDVNRDGEGAGFPNLSEARAQFGAAAELYEGLGWRKWEAFNLYALAGVQQIEGDRPGSCVTLARSKAVYYGAPDAAKATESFEKAGAFTIDRYADLEARFGCAKPSHN